MFTIYEQYGAADLSFLIENTPGVRYGGMAFARIWNSKWEFAHCFKMYLLGEVV
jgi:hypothetical protein